MEKIKDKSVLGAVLVVLLMAMALPVSYSMGVSKGESTADKKAKAMVEKYKKERAHRTYNAFFSLGDTYGYQDKSYYFGYELEMREKDGKINMTLKNNNDGVELVIQADEK